MRDSAGPPQSDLADRWSRRSVISGLTALGITQVSSRSGAANVGGDRFCKVVIDTELGPIGVLLELGRAPISAGDFLRYVDRGLYAGGAFYRTVRPDRSRARRIDRRQQVSGPHRSRAGTGTAGAFFVCIGDQPELDFGGKRNPDGQGFAAFGHVTNGMKLIREMGALKTQGPPGSSAGELIASPVQILGARRV